MVSFLLINWALLETEFRTFNDIMTATEALWRISTTNYSPGSRTVQFILFLKLLTQQNF